MPHVSEKRRILMDQREIRRMCRPLSVILTEKSVNDANQRSCLGGRRCVGSHDHFESTGSPPPPSQLVGYDFQAIVAEWPAAIERFSESKRSLVKAGECLQPLCRSPDPPLAAV